MCAAAALAAGEAKKPPRPAVIAAGQQTHVSSLSLLPGTLSFAATDPDGAGATTVSVSAVIGMSGGSSSRNWTLSVSAAAPLFAGCASVPASALRITACTVTPPNGGGSGSCSAATLPLSPSPQQIAGGKQGNGTKTFQVNFDVGFTDSWGYVAQQAPPCTINLIYAVDAP
jgi:hypothetical protein